MIVERIDKETNSFSSQLCSNPSSPIVSKEILLGDIIIFIFNPRLSIRITLASFFVASRSDKVWLTRGDIRLTRKGKWLVYSQTVLIPLLSHSDCYLKNCFRPKIDRILRFYPIFPCIPLYCIVNDVDLLTTFVLRGNEKDGRTREYIILIVCQMICKIFFQLTNSDSFVSGTVTWFRKRSREKSWGVYALSAVSLWSLYRCLLSSVISAEYITRISGPISERRRGWAWKFFSFLFFFLFFYFYFYFFFFFHSLSKHRHPISSIRMENDGGFESRAIYLRVVNLLSVNACYRKRARYVSKFNSTLIPARSSCNSTDRRRVERIRVANPININLRSMEMTEGSPSFSIWISFFLLLLFFFPLEAEKTRDWIWKYSF